MNESIIIWGIGCYYIVSGIVSATLYVKDSSDDKIVGYALLCLFLGFVVLPLFVLNKIWTIKIK